jgi:hypothetical protein
LLLAECNYWRKHGTVRWIRQGEDNTQKIHCMASKRLRKNSISMCVDELGNEVLDHQAMARLLWSSFKIEWASLRG